MNGEGAMGHSVHCTLLAHLALDWMKRKTSYVRYWDHAGVMFNSFNPDEVGI